MKKMFTGIILLIALAVLLNGCTGPDNCNKRCTALGYEKGECIRSGSALDAPSCAKSGGTLVLDEEKPIPGCHLKAIGTWDECCCFEKEKECKTDADCEGKPVKCPAVECPEYRIYCDNGNCVCDCPFIETTDFEVHEWGVIAGCPESGNYFLTSRPEQVMLVKQPVVYIHSNGLEEFDLKVGLTQGKPTLTYPEAKTSGNTVEWKNVKVKEQGKIKGSEPSKGFEPVPLKQIIPTLNNVDADTLEFNGTESRFLFYEGEMPFENKISVSCNKTTKKAFLKNNSGHTVYDLTVSVLEEDSFIDKRALFGYLKELKPSEEKEIDLLEKQGYPDTKEIMKKIGFTEKESESFHSLWQMNFYFPSNTENFARLSYRLPRTEVEKMISLEFNPEPKKEIRAMWVMVDLPTLRLNALEKEKKAQC